MCILVGNHSNIYTDATSHVNVDGNTYECVFTVLFKLFVVSLIDASICGLLKSKLFSIKVECSLV